MEEVLYVTINRKIMEVSSENLLCIQRMQKEYGKVLARFLEALRSGELRCYATKKPHALRDELVSVLKIRKDDPKRFDETVEQIRQQRRPVFAGLLKYIPTIPLQARHWKLALEEANQMVAAHWGLVAKRATERVVKAKWFNSLGEKAKAYVQWLLEGSSQQFFEVLANRTPRTSVNNLERHGFDPIYSQRLADLYPQSEFVQLSQADIAFKVGKLLNKVRHKEHFPTNKHWNRVDFDCSCWTEGLESGVVNGKEESIQYVELMTDEPRKRLHLRLKGRSLLRGTLQLKTEKDNRLTLKVCMQFTEAELRQLGEELGMDLGFKGLFHDSNGNHYGDAYYMVTEKYQERQRERQRGRNRCFARKQYYEKKGTKSALKKAKNIENNNLGRKTFLKAEFKWKETCKCIINHALNCMLKPLIVNSDGTVVGVRKLFIEKLGKMEFSSSKRFSKKLRRALASGWIRHYIHERIVLKCKKYGIELKEVDPSYTSQTCSRCGFCCRDNRNWKLFKCLKCGYSEDADTNAAKNILARGREMENGSGRSLTRQGRTKQESRPPNP